METTTSNSRSIADSVAVITGAGSGMGRATARLFAAEGAHVAACEINRDNLDQVAGEIEAAGHSILACPIDLRDAEAIKGTVEEIAERFGGIDILVNNAGISRPGPVDSNDYEARWAESLEVLLTAQVRLVRAALPYLKQARAPRIINIASTEGLGATAQNSPYSAAKHGVVGLTRSLAVELGRFGITVNCICPGPINTNMTAAIPEEHKATYARRRTALRRYGEPEEVAQMTLSLALPAASFVTGVALPVDGGLTVRRA